MAYTGEVFYTTLEAVLRALNTGMMPGAGPAPNVQPENDFIWWLIPKVSAAITAYIKTTCVPVYQSLQCRVGNLYNTTVLRLPEPVISLTQVVNGDTVEVTGDINLLPVSTLPSVFIEYAGGWVLPTMSSYVQVAGLFGWYVNSNHLYRTVAAGIDLAEGITSLAVSAAVAAQIEQGDLLALGTELLLCTDKSGTDPVTLTLDRAVNNSTGADHVDADLRVYQIDPRIQHIATEMTMWFYKNRHRVNEVYQVPGGTVTVGGMDPALWKELDDLSPRTRLTQPYK